MKSRVILVALSLAVIMSLAKPATGKAVGGAFSTGGVVGGSFSSLNGGPPVGGLFGGGYGVGPHTGYVPIGNFKFLPFLGR